MNVAIGEKLTLNKSIVTSAAGLYPSNTQRMNKQAQAYITGFLVICPHHHQAFPRLFFPGFTQKPEDTSTVAYIQDKCTLTIKVIPKNDLKLSPSLLYSWGNSSSALNSSRQSKGTLSRSEPVIVPVTIWRLQHGGEKPRAQEDHANSSPKGPAQPRSQTADRLAVKCFYMAHLALDCIASVQFKARYFLKKLHYNKVFFLLC